MKTRKLVSLFLILLLLLSGGCAKEPASGTNGGATPTDLAATLSPLPSDSGEPTATVSPTGDAAPSTEPLPTEDASVTLTVTPGEITGTDAPTPTDAVTPTDIQPSPSAQATATTKPSATAKPTATKQPTATPTATKKPTATPTASAKVEIPSYNISHASVPNNSAMQFVSDMKIGWNLGNTLDASNCTWLSNELDYESAWCGIKTTQAMIDAIQAAGFNTIRIPVSWHDHVSGPNHTISPAWLARVKQVVDYAYNNGMYVILNAHHDCESSYYYPSGSELAASQKYLTDIWTQLCSTFSGYGNRLIFESMNEPRLTGTNLEWWPYNNSAYQDSIAAINALNQTFVDTVRASGGNNANRYLMVPAYAASYDSAVTYGGFVLPTDSTANRLIVSIHAYTPYSFALDASGTSSFTTSSQNEILKVMKGLYNAFIKTGVPVVIGEFGAVNKNNLQDRVNFATYYIAAARAYGITCCWWDNNAFSGNGENFGLLDRKTVTIRFPEIVTGLMKYAK